jgi:hypothetical protein
MKIPRKSAKAPAKTVSIKDIILPLIHSIILHFTVSFPVQCAIWN